MQREETLSLPIVADHPERKAKLCPPLGPHMLGSCFSELNRCSKAFSEMYTHEELVDVAIKTPDTVGSANGSCLWAHKVVLSAVSPVLRRMLTGSFKEAKENEIMLQDVNMRILRGFLDFIYLGRTQVCSLSELLELGKLADLLQVISLRDLVLETAREQLSATSCALLLQAGKNCGLRRVQEMALDYAVLHLDEVAATDAFLALDEELLAELIASDQLSSSEEALFEYTLRWMTYGRSDDRSEDAPASRQNDEGITNPDGEVDTESRAARAEEAGWVIRGEDLLRHIRFPVMDGQYLALHVHQRRSLLAKSTLLRDLATEAALWQLVPDESKHLFQLRSLSPDVLEDRPGRWDVGQSEVRQVLRGQAEEVQCLAVWQHMLLSGSVDSSIWVWNTQTWQCERKLQHHQGAVCALDIAGRLLFSGSVDCTICVWDLHSWSCIDVLQGHTKSVFALKTTKDVLLSGGDDCKVKVWQLPSAHDALEGCLSPPTSHEPRKGVLDGCLTLSDHTKAVCALEASGRRAFSGSFDKTIRVWDTTTWTCLRILTGHEGGVCTMVAAGGWLISGSVDILVWNLKDLSEHCALAGHNGGVNELAVIGKKVLGAFDDKLIRVWSTDDWQLQRTIVGHVGAVYALAVDSSKLYTASYDRCIRAWY